jgi:hypothetical protein
MNIINLIQLVLRFVEREQADLNGSSAEEKISWKEFPLNSGNSEMLRKTARLVSVLGSGER